MRSCVAARHRPQKKAPTKLAGFRVAAGLTQDEMSWATGIPIATYNRLERGELQNPRIAWLTNAAIVLKRDLDEVIEDWMRTWYVALGQHAPPPQEWYESKEVRARRQPPAPEQDWLLLSRLAAESERRAGLGTTPSK
jgi:transcriptional regulator with XRE-family HTH domain